MAPPTHINHPAFGPCFFENVYPWTTERKFKFSLCYADMLKQAFLHKTFGSEIDLNLGWMFDNS